MKRKVLFFLVAFVSSTIIADETINVSGIWYELYTATKTASVYGPYTWDGQNLTIPSTITSGNLSGSKTYNVVSIRAGAFSSRPNISSLSLPNSITTIGANAFSGCALTSITIPEGVTSIGTGAFNCAGLKTVTIKSNSLVSTDFTSTSNISSIFGKQVETYILGNNITTIGANAFANCSTLTSITLPSSLISIREWAFYGCSGLTSINIPSTVTDLGNHCFQKCTGLTSLVIPNNVSLIGNYAFQECVNLSSITIGNNVTSIGDNAFCKCTNINSINIPSNITSIGNNAFSECVNITSINIPSNIIHIGDNAFSDCSNLQTVTFNASNCEDASNAILSANVTNIQIGTNVKRIPNHLCESTSITSITIPEKVEYIGSSAFYQCRQLKTVVWNAINCDFKAGLSSSNREIYQIQFGNKVQVIPEKLCWSLDSITNVTFPSSIKVIGDKSFQSCIGLNNINITSSDISIGNMAFAYCSGITNISFANGLKQIGNGAFFYCENITSINLPSSLTDIGSKAFYGCSALRVVLPDSLVHIGANALYNTFTYSLDRNWNNGVLYVNNYLIQGVDSKGLSANCSIQEGTTLIADAAFSGSSKLTSVTLPASLKHIGNRAFYNCSKINSAINIPECLETIGDSAMYFKSNIKTSFVYDLYLPRTLTYIGSGAFWNDNSDKAAINAIYAYMQTPPAIDARTFNLQASMANTPVYVFADDANSYYNAEVWKQFDIQVISAPSVTVSDSIEIDITRTEVTFKWQKIAQAKIYKLSVLNQNGDTIEVVAFNDQGEIKYDDRRLMKSNAASSNGFQYTVSNLENKTTYSYVLQALNAAKIVLKEYSDSFVTGLRYTVRFVDWDDALLKEEIVRESESAIPPADPVRDGYIFKGWDKDYTNINNNMTIKALYERDVVYYTITFLDWDGTELFVEQVEEGHDAVGPSILPTREGYTFIGWSKPITNIQSNLTVIAQYQLNEGIEDIYIDGVNSSKVIIDGQILIIRGNKIYTVQGQEIRKNEFLINSSSR